MKYLEKEIYDAIYEISDLNLQKKLWLNQNNDTGLISSYTEAMCSLFDDFHFDEFVDDASSVKKFDFSTIYELNKLRDLLKKYDEKKSQEEIINDPEWRKVVDQAKVVIDKWNK